MKADLTTRRENLLSYASERVDQIGSLSNKLIKYGYAFECIFMSRDDDNPRRVN